MSLDTELKQALDSLGAEHKTAFTGLKGLIDALQTKCDMATRRADEVEALFRRAGSPDGGGEYKSLGQQFIESADFLARRGRPWGPNATFGNLAVKNFWDFERKTTITSAAVGSATPGILTGYRMPGVYSPPQPAVRVRDLLARFPITQNAVEFVRRNVFTNAAAVVAEASDKAESAITWEIIQEMVRTLAHWVPATRQVLDDAPQLRSAIDGDLIEGLRDAEDSELLSGDGTGQHLDGLTNQATAYDTADDAEGDTRIDTINHAIKQIQAHKYRVDAVVLNPADWMDMQAIKDAEERYVLGGPGQISEARLWGKRVVECDAMTAGEFLVGAFANNAVLFERQEATIDVSTEHSDYFVKNMVAIRAEERLVLAVKASNAFAYGEFPS